MTFELLWPLINFEKKNYIHHGNIRVVFIFHEFFISQLSRKWLKESVFSMPVKLSDSLTLNTSIRFVPGEVSLRRVPTSKPGALFGAKMQQVLKWVPHKAKINAAWQIYFSLYYRREKRNIPFIISACIREVERRGMYEIGVYRVSGSASDLAKLKKSFETSKSKFRFILCECWG